MAINATVLRGTPAYSAGKFGNGMSGGALGAPGVLASQFPAAGSTYPAPMTGAFTVEGWVKLATLPSGIKVAFGLDTRVWVGITAAGFATSQLGGGLSGKQTLTGTTNIADNAWHHLAVTYDGYSGTALYVDGTRQASGSTPALLQDTAPTYDGLVIGGFGGASLAGFDWPGMVDDVALLAGVQYVGASITPPSVQHSPTRLGQTNLYRLESDGTDSDAADVATPIPPNNVGYYYSPYNWDVTAQRALCNTGGYMRTVINGKPPSVTFHFDVSNVPTDASTRSQIEYRIDRQAWIAVVPSATVTASIPAATVAWSKHLVELRMKSSSEAANRWDSPYLTAVKFLGVSFLGSGGVSEPEQAALTGLFYGDSITEGTNTLSSTGDASNRGNSRLSWCTTVASVIGAEVGVVGFGRQGLAVAGNGNVPVLGSTWNFIASGIPRSFTVTPDFVAVNIGTNDSRNGISAATFTAAYTSFLNALIVQFPRTTKLIVFRPFGGYYTASDYRAAIAATTEPSRVAYVETSGWWNSEDSSDGLHPYGYINESELGPLAAAAIRDVLNAGREYLNRGGVAVPLWPQRR